VTTLDIVLVVVAVLLLVVFATKVVYRYPRKDQQVDEVGVWMMAGGLAAALVAFVVLRHILHRYLKYHGHGHIYWLNHGFVPGLLVVACAAVIGYWFWWLERRRYHKD